MKKSKFLSIIAIVVSCLMILVACNPASTGGGTTPVKKPKDGDVCIELDIKKMPTKLEYKEGEKFNPAGLLFDAVYQNGFDGDTGLIGADLDGFKPTGPLAASVKQIELIFEGFSKFIDITVVPKTLIGMEITREPDIKSYFVGDALDLSGLTVKATYEEGEVESELNYTVTDKNGKAYKQGDILEDALGVTEMTVTVTSGEATKTDTFPIAVYRGMTIQAEDYLPDGEDAPTDRSYTKLSGKKITELVKADCTFTGTGYIGNISNDVVIEFNIYCEEAIENADLVLIASSTNQSKTEQKMDDMQFNKIYKAYIDYNDGNDEQEIYFDNDIVIEGKPYPPANSGGSIWTNWADVPFVRVDLPQGFTKVKVKCIGSIKDKDGTGYDRTPNVDRLDIRAVDGDDEVTRGDYVTAFTVKNNPTKLAYKEGEKVDLTGLVFDAEYRNGYTGGKDLGPDRINSYTPSGALTANDKKITLKFKNWTEEIPITVTAKQITSIALTREPDTKIYAKNGTLNLGGLVVTATYDDGSTGAVTGYTVKDGSGKVYTNGMALDTVGEITLTVEYGGRTTSPFTITVSEGITMEAETFLAEGAEHPTDASYMIFTRGDAKQETGNGSVCISNITPATANRAATKFEFYIWSDTEYKAADIIFVMASTNNNGSSVMGNTPFDKVFKVSVGDGDAERQLEIDKRLVIEGKELPNSTASRWFLWTEVNVGKTDIVKGFNKITLECIGQYKSGDGSNRTANFDKLIIRANSDVNTEGKTLQSVSVVKARTYYEKNAKLDYKNIQVRAEYTDGTVISDAHNFVVKDASGNEYHDGDSLGADKHDIELFAEISDGTNVKRDAFTIHVATDPKIRVEAENTTVSENSSYTVINGTVGDNKDCKVNTGVANASGKGVIESINKIGLTIDFMVYSESAVNNATVVLNASTLDRGSGFNYDVRFDKLFELYIDDVKVDVGDATIFGRDANGDSGWFLFTDSELCKVNLKAGFTKITLKVIGKVRDTNGGVERVSNIDSLDIKY